MISSPRSNSCPRCGSAGSLAGVGGVVLAVLAPKCPLCFAGYAWLAATVGVGVGAYGVALIVLVGISALVLARSALLGRRPFALLPITGGCCSIVASRFSWGSPALAYFGLAVLVFTTAWLWMNPRESVPVSDAARQRVP